MNDDHDAHLAIDLRTLARRRFLLGGAGMAGATLLTSLGCGGASTTSGDSTTSTSTSSSSGTSSSSTCALTVTETNGPYPADGSNTAPSGVSDALTLSGIVRSDITSSFGDMSGTAAGVPATLTLTLVDEASSCADLADYAIYIWHCDRDGDYSLYTAPTQNYLRGVQATDASGQVTFTTIFPACYSGRMPHIHIEVYKSLATATAGSNALLITQLAFPTDVCTTVYDTATGYASSATNFAQISFATDPVFSDGTSTEMSTVSGSVADGYSIALTLAIAA